MYLELSGEAKHGPYLGLYQRFYCPYQVQFMGLIFLIFLAPDVHM